MPPFPSPELMIILGGCFTAFLTFLTTLGGGMYWFVSTLLGWAADHLNPVIKSHKQMVDTATTEMPKVSETLAALQQTQVKQCEALDLACKAQERHEAKLDTIVNILTKSNGDIVITKESPK